MSATILAAVLALTCRVCAVGAPQAGPHAVDLPSYNQMTKEGKVCGQYCLTAVLQSFGKNVRMEDLMPIIPAAPSGSSLAQLARAARNYELHAVGAKVTARLLFDMHLAAILHVNDGHFIALIPRADGPGFTVVDSSSAVEIDRAEELMARWRWKGDCLFLSSQDIVLPEASSPGWMLARYAAIALGAGILVWLLGRRWILSTRAPSRSWWLAVTPLLVAFLLGSPWPPGQAAEKAPSGSLPRISVEQPVFDAGIVFDNIREISHVFEIANEGTADLVVREIKTDCSCTVVAGEKIKTIAPGASVSLTLRFRLGGRFGKPMERKTLVVTNDPMNPKTVLVVRAEYHQEFMVEPPALLPGPIPLGADKMLFLRVTPYDNQRRACVEKASASCSFVHLSAVKGTKEESAKGVRLLKVHVLPTAPAGLLETKIYIPCTGGSRETLEVPLRGEVVGPIRLSLTQLQFGLIAADSRPATRRVVLTSAKPFTVLALKSSSPCMSVGKDGESNGRCSVVVTLAPGQDLKGQIEGLVTVETDMPEMRIVRIPVFAYFL